MDLKDVVYGNSPLHWASLTSSYRTVLFLLHRNAKVNEKNLNGDLAIHMATRSNAINVVASFIARHPELSGQFDKLGRRPIELAIGTEVTNTFLAFTLVVVFT